MADLVLTGSIVDGTGASPFAGWVAVSTSAAGVYGFTRALPSAITSTTNPPAGVAQDALVPPRG